MYKMIDYYDKVKNDIWNTRNNAYVEEYLH